jgi:capsule polysaccharide export protein KpsE/RkpR
MTYTHDVAYDDSPEVEGLKAEIDRLKEENQRYREALEKVEKDTRVGQYTLHTIVKEALTEPPSPEVPQKASSIPPRT